MNLRGKKGQLTIFIVIAILIVAGVALFFVFRDNLKGDKGISQEFQPIYDYVLSCIEETTLKGVKIISSNGGYYEIPPRIVFEYFTDDYPFYYYNNEIHLPSIEEVEIELEKYLSENLKYCIDFETFEEQGYIIQDKEVSVSLDLDDEEIITKIDYPLIISKADESVEIREFKINVNSKIKENVGLSLRIVEDYSVNPGEICLTCLENYFIDTGFHVYSEFISNNPDVILFSIEDLNSENKWRFVVQG